MRKKYLKRGGRHRERKETLTKFYEYDEGNAEKVKRNNTRPENIPTKTEKIDKSKRNTKGRKQDDNREDENCGM